MHFKDLGDELRAHVAAKLGKFTSPKYLTFTSEVPKTRSGKIMRRLLRDIAEGRILGDTTTLADSSVVALLQARAKNEAHQEERLLLPEGQNSHASSLVHMRRLPQQKRNLQQLWTDEILSTSRLYYLPH